MRELIKITGTNLANEPKIKHIRWTNIFSGRTKIRHENEAIAKAFPDYDYWLTFDKELPDVGQISPVTKKAMEDYHVMGKDA